MSLNVTSADPISLFMIFDEIQSSTSYLFQTPDYYYYIPMFVLAAVFLTGGTLSTILLYWFILTEYRKGCLICGVGTVIFGLAGCMLLPVSFLQPYATAYIFMIVISGIGSLFYIFMKEVV